MSTLISLRNVEVRYKKAGNIFSKSKYFRALRDVSFDVKDGESVGIVGRNGAGKSTLLRLMSGVIRPDGGRVLNHGATVALLSLQVGFDGNLSGRDNAIISGMLQGKSKREVVSKLDAICEFSELGDFFNEPVRTYSSGMRTRLGFSISTIVSPDVLLVDEVLSVGDHSFRAKAEDAMKEKLASNQTVVLVSHSVQQIERVCDRAILIEDGINFADGSPSEIVKIYQERLPALQHG